MILACAWASYGQTIRLQNFSAQQGLAQSRLTALAQDSVGFLWVGTGSGLYRFDGTAFRAFIHRRGDTTSLAADDVLALETAPHNQLLVGTIDGLCTYDFRTERFRRHRLRTPGQPATKANWIESLRLDPGGRLWVLAIGSAYRADRLGQPIRPLRIEPRRAGGLTSPQIRLGRRCRDADGRIWLATVHGINVFDPATGTYWNYHHNPRHWAALADSGSVRALTLDARGRVWYSYWERGLCCFDPATNQIQRWHHDPADPTSLPAELINVLTFDRTGLLWVGTLLNGAARFDPTTGRCERLLPNPSDPTALPSGAVNDILEDRQGNVWFATEGGLSLLSPLTRPFAYWPAPPHPVTGVSAALGPILPDALGRLWVGTYSQGLLRFDPATGHFHRVAAPPVPGSTEPTNFHDLIWSLAPAPGNRFWVGTQAGLLLFDPRTERWEPLPPGLPEFVRSTPTVSALLRASDGALWIGSFSRGLVRYEPATGRAQIFRGADPSGGDTLVNRIWRLVQDSAGNVWVGGMHGAGISRLTAGTWQVRTWRHGQPGGPTDDDCYALLADPAGVWIGTHRRGLNRFRTGRTGFREISRDDGLSNNYIMSLARAPNGHLWAGSVAGLNELDPRTGRIRAFGLPEGLPETQCNGGAWTDAGGALWFTTDHHLIRVWPERLVANAVPPPVRLVGFQVNGQRHRLPTPDSLLTLLPGENTLAFEFAAANLLAPDRNRFAWRLEGADPRWSPAGPQRAVTYANLPPGRYTLRVRAANNDGLWNQRGLTLHLRLLPPWYRTWWFYSLLVLAGATVLYAFYRQRLARAVALERARNQIARDLHDEIGSTLSSILMQSRVPTPGVEQARMRLQKIGDYAEPMLQAMDEIVWAVNPRFDPMPAVLARMRVFAAEACEPRGIELYFETTGPLERLRLPLQRRREFYLIFKEALNNALKYAQARHLWVRVQADSRTLRLEIRDDGVGFDPAAPPQGTGNGLRNLRQRAQNLKGRLILTTAPGQGTSVVLEVGV